MTTENRFGATAVIWLARLASLAALVCLLLLPMGLYFVLADQPEEASYATTMTLIIIGGALGAIGAHLTFILILARIGGFGPDEVRNEWRRGR